MSDKSQFLRHNAKVRFTATLKKQLIAELEKCFAPALAARAVGICPETYRQHYINDPEFHAAVDEARKVYAQSLRQEVHRRGVTGWEEPVFYKGIEVGKVRKYSDALMLRHIARFDPSYREATKVEQNTTVTGSVEVLKSKVAGLPAPLRERLRELAKAARAAEAEAQQAVAPEES